MSQTPEALEQPFFVVASERSGTTLLYLMLSHHPRLSVLQEMEYLCERLSDRGELPSSDQLRASLQDDRVFRGAALAIEPGLTAAELGRSFFRQQLEREGKSLPGATVHKEFHRMDRLWPRARYIHLVRDGRDVARSCIQMGWDGNVYTGCDRWIEAEELWSSFREAIPSERRLELRYEGLIEQPEAELRRICRFLGIEYDEGMLSYPADSTYSAPDARLTQQWRRKFTPAELALVEGRIGALLVERGYELSGEAARQVGPVGRRLLRFGSRLARTRFRMNRFGGGLLLADFVTRQLRIPALNAPIRRRLDDIDDAHMK